MAKQNRTFEKEKSEKKGEAIRLWKSGRSVTQIARELSVSRDTLYRWIKTLDHDLSQSRTRSRVQWDPITRDRILELFILLKAPAIPILNRLLRELFHIRYSDVQLRYGLKKMGVYHFK